MFKLFKRGFEAQPRFAVGDLVCAKYDISNGNGVFTRGSVLKVTKYKVGSYCQGISYSLEDNIGNIVTGVDECMLSYKNDSDSSKFRCFIKRITGDISATANIEEEKFFEESEDDSSKEDISENGIKFGEKKKSRSKQSEGAVARRSNKKRKKGK